MRNMISQFTIGIAVLILAPLMASAESSRQLVDLNGSWKFFPAFVEVEVNHKFMGEIAQGAEGVVPEKHYGWVHHDFDDSSWWDKKVPASWNTEFEDLWSYEGQGWYRKLVEVPDSWKGKYVSFISDGANYRTLVYVNGQLAGQHDGGFTQFSVPIHEYLNYGTTNTIAVSVDNKSLLERVPMERHDWWQHGGLYRPVRLEVKEPEHIASIKIETDALSPTPQVTVIPDLNVDKDGMRLRAVFMDQGNAVIAEESVLAGNKIVLDVPNAKLWSPESPYLYSLNLEMIDGDELIDSIVRKVGIRSIQLTEDQLLLNGEPYLIKGVNRYEDYAETGMTNTPALLQKDMELIKGLGANAVRCHYTFAPETYALLDEVGLLAVCEVPLYQWGRPGHSEKNTEAAISQLKEIIATLRNHPSVAMWSVSNETRTRPREPGEEHKKLSEMVVRGNIELLRLAKALDPTRPVIAPSNRWPNDPIFTDTSLNSINVYLGVAAPYTGGMANIPGTIAERFDGVREHYPNRPILVSEFGAWSLRGLETDYFPGEGYQAAFLKLHWEEFLKQPGFIGGFIWAFADNDVHRKYTRIYETRCAYGLFDLKRRPKASVKTMQSLWLTQE